ncbi:cation transporter dimerization domain-containing protein [Brachybacterium sp. GCM10030267]|uniref:cation transporter dimerization domain-containing protein n=1 Tax=Brachybacterium sp. GCM10030267 TaxID=3273381 RepID=UPI00361750F3
MFAHQSQTTAAEVPGVIAVRRARARWSGHRLEADLDITVDSTLTVNDGHRIAEAVHDTLRRGVPHLDHASIHVTPEAPNPTSHTHAGTRED